MTEQKYLELYNFGWGKYIYFRPEKVPFDVPEYHPTMYAYVLDTRLHEGSLYHRDDENFKHPYALLTFCESWDAWHPKCPNCGASCMAFYTSYDDHIYQGYCPSCQARGPFVGDWQSKTAEWDAYEKFFHPDKGKVSSLDYYPSEDLDFRYHITLQDDNRYMIAFHHDASYNPYKKQKLYATLDLAKKGCLRDFQRRVRKKATSWGYIKLAEGEIVVKKSDICEGCRCRILGIASPPDAAEFYETEEQP